MATVVGNHDKLFPKWWWKMVINLMVQRKHNIKQIQVYLPITIHWSHRTWPFMWANIAIHGSYGSWANSTNRGKANFQKKGFLGKDLTLLFSCEFTGTPAMPPPPPPMMVASHLLTRPYFLGAWHWRATLKFPWSFWWVFGSSWSHMKKSPMNSEIFC